MFMSCFKFIEIYIGIYASVKYESCPIAQLVLLRKYKCNYACLYIAYSVYTYLLNYCIQDPSFLFLSQRRLDIGSKALQRTLAALSQAICQSEGLQYHESNNDLLPLDQVTVLCHQAELLCPGCGNGYWEQLKVQILEANEELAHVGEYLQVQSAFSVNTAIAGELDILCSLSRSMVHLGVVLSQLLLPSPVDPVHMASIYYQCHYHMVCAYVCIFKVIVWMHECVH